MVYLLYYSLCSTKYIEPHLYGSKRPTDDQTNPSDSDSDSDSPNYSILLAVNALAPKHEHIRARTAEWRETKIGQTW